VASRKDLVLYLVYHSDYTSSTVSTIVSGWRFDSVPGYFQPFINIENF